MKIESYSYVFSGLNPDPYYAAAAEYGTVWAVASSNESGGAYSIVETLDDLDQRDCPLNNSDLEEHFTMHHLTMQRMKAEISVAGLFTDEKNLNLFNIGNARALLFDNGYMTMHTNDDSEAYQNFQSGDINDLSAYDRIRLQPNHLTLTKSLGGNGGGKPHFYMPIPLRKDISVLLCTEPFWRYLNVMEMELDYRKSAGPKEWVRFMVRRVMMKSNQKLDNDNFAVAALMIEE